MSYTKQQFVEAAFEEIGMAAYVFDLQPEQLTAGLRRLDALMAEWNARGVRLGYPLPTSPDDSNLSDESNVPDSANSAIIMHLAMRLAPLFGKQAMPATAVAAMNAYHALLNTLVRPQPQVMPADMPMGAGSKPWVTGKRFADEPEDNAVSPQLDKPRFLNA